MDLNWHNIGRSFGGWVRFEGKAFGGRKNMIEKLYQLDLDSWNESKLLLWEKERHGPNNTVYAVHANTLFNGGLLFHRKIHMNCIS